MTDVMTPAQIQSDFGDPTKFTNVTWAATVLALIGAPITQNNIDNFTTWMTAENGSGTWTGTAGANNPLNNGLGSGGGAGLGSYPDLLTAAYYAAKGVEGGISGAAPIGAALKANAPFAVFQAATIKSGWASSHYAGSGYAGLSSAAPPPTVTVADAAKHSTTHNPTVGDVGSIAAANVGGPSSFWGTIGGSLNTLTGGVVGDAVGAAKSAVSWTESAGKILGEIDTLAFWQRVGMGVLGVGLIIFGSLIFFSSTKTGQKTISEGTSAAEAAAVA